MIALYASKYTIEDLATLSAAIESALLQFSGCTWDCSECSYKRPCRDLNNLNKHINDLLLQKGEKR